MRALNMDISLMRSKEYPVSFASAAKSGSTERRPPPPPRKPEEWDRVRINGCVWFDRYFLCMPNLLFDASSPRGGFKIREMCRHYQDDGHSPSNCFSFRRWADLPNGKPMCFCRKARDDAKADMYLRFLSLRAIWSVRGGLQRNFGNPKEFDQGDLWRTAVAVLREEFEGNLDIRPALKKVAAAAREGIGKSKTPPAYVGFRKKPRQLDPWQLLTHLKHIAYIPEEWLCTTRSRN